MSSIRLLLLAGLMTVGTVSALCEDATFPSGYEAKPLSNPYISEFTSVGGLSSIKVAQPASNFKKLPVDVTLANDVVTATFINEEKGVSVTSQSVSTELDFWDNNAFIFKFPGLPSNGVWRFELQEGALMASNGASSPEITGEWTLSDPSLNAVTLPFTAVPAPGSAFAGIKNGTTITLDFDEYMSRIAYCEMSMADVTPGIEDADIYVFPDRSAYKRSGAGTVNMQWLYDDSPIVFNMGGETLMKFLVGHTYQIDVKAYNKDGDGKELIGVCSFTYVGSSEAYDYAPETLLSISPEPVGYNPDNRNGDTLTDVNVPIVMTFSGSVDCLQAAVAVPSGGYSNCITASNSDKSEWSFIIPHSFFQAPGVDLVFSFTGTNGNRVKGTNGEEGTSYFAYNFKIESQGTFIFANPAAGEVEEISRIKITSAGNMAISVNNSELDLYLADGNGNNIQKFDIEEDASGRAVYLVANPACTTPGEYKVEIAPGIFSIGDGIDSSVNAVLNLNYTILPKVGTLILHSITPAVSEQGAGLDELKQFTLLFDDEVSVSYGEMAALYKGVGTDLEKVADAEMVLSADSKSVTVEFAEPVVDPGVYTLVIPANSIYDKSYETDAGLYGSVLPEQRFTYTVSGVNGVTTILNTVHSYTVFSPTGVCLMRNASAGDVKNLEKGVYIINGYKVMIK